MIRGRDGIGIQVSHMLFADDTLVGRVENAELLAAEPGYKVDLSPPLIWGSLWVLRISRWWCGTEWKRGCGRDLPCGRGSSFLREEESLSFGALWREVWGRRRRVEFWWGKEGYGVGLWKEISKEGSLLLNNVSFSVGDGKRVRFWKDIWCGSNSLCEAFPSLFALAVSKEVWVADCWDLMGEEGGWTPRFSRPFNDWEVGGDGEIPFDHSRKEAEC
ncbi:hypothetical protein CK203_002941 [Vitis vinifera]|uniref:Uncharacterized protein n=1 Tax=Vitis vinifera TaxID=29760 RepID=A0A438KI44_VITVI|nr:hypothetical protein CK203_002941 [Vitis vinifera]